MISYILPTYNRPERLAQTLDALGSLPSHGVLGGAEVVIADNASTIPPAVPESLRNGLPVRVVRRPTNEGAAARNAAAAECDERSGWVVMLDDDSYPIDLGFARGLLHAPPEVGAVSADIFLPGGEREAGGLPEVFIGCGVAFRRRVFLGLGGYDASFNYYAEEYDLSARLMLAGYRVRFDPWFRVRHHKVAEGRDMNVILARLVRNNGWVAQRYSPESHRREELREVRRRYRAIAEKEGALGGFAEGLRELRRTIRKTPRTPLSETMFDRFTGLSAARSALASAQRNGPFATAAIVDEGKNAWVVRRALSDLGVREVGVDEKPAALVIGTMSPGPMLDAFERRSAAGVFRGPRVIAPWAIAGGRHLLKAEDVLAGGRVRAEKIPA